MSTGIFHKFYCSKKWQKTREYVLQRDFHICQLCGKADADTVHHKIFLNSSNINDTNITLNTNNLITVCRDCHDKIHNRNQYNNNYEFDSNGRIVSIKQHKTKVKIITGAPASGKTTYVKNNMDKQNDIVIDIDYICNALRYCNMSTHRDNSICIDLVLQIRDTIYNYIEQSVNANINTCWIVTASNNQEQIKQLANRLDAEIVYIDTNYNNCINNVLADDTRKDKELYIQLVNKYFKK